VSQHIEHALNQEDPLLPVTASGAPNRLLCPDPVRHMSVINQPVEHVIANCEDLRRRLERLVDADLVESPRRSARYKRMQHRSVRKGRAAGENRRAHIRPARASGSRTARSAWRPGGDIISNYRTDLLILRIVTGGR
jgi:hypothetical protein